LDQGVQDVFIKRLKADQSTEAKADAAAQLTPHPKGIFKGERHANVAQPMEVYWHNDRIITVANRLSDTSLYEHLRTVQAKGYSPEEVRTIVRAICLGVQFLHHHGVAHRQLTPDHIRGGHMETLKICDFEGAQHLPEVQEGIECRNIQDGEVDERLLAEVTSPDPHYEETRIFTDNFFSPEYRRGVHNPFAGDVWSMGQILYLMLMGNFSRLKMTSEAVSDMLDTETPLRPGAHHIQQGVWMDENDNRVETEKVWTDGLKALLRGMTAPDRDRFTINEVLDHPWMKEPQSPEPLPEEVLQGLRVLDQHVIRQGHQGDFYTMQIWSKGIHQTANASFRRDYSLKATHPKDLSPEMKEYMPNWQRAEKMLCFSTKSRNNALRVAW